jgi:hypothetical protein
MATLPNAEEVLDRGAERDVRGAKLGVTSRVLRFLGFCAFAVAFPLPAVKSSVPNSVYSGWYCASITLAQSMPSAQNGAAHFDLGGFVQGIPFLNDGWVNPLVIIYLVLVAIHQANIEFRGATRMRRVVAYAVLICVIDCWGVMLGCQLVPLIGHFLWIGGILLMISPEFFDLSRMPLRSQPALSKR